MNLWFDSNYKCLKIKKINQEKLTEKSSVINLKVELKGVVSILPFLLV